MANTIPERAAKITCVACSIATKKVSIKSLDPFVVSPADVLDRTFKDISIKAESVVEVFKKAAAELLPADQKGRAQIETRILNQKIDTGKKVSKFADFLAGLIFQQEG
jgi:hypothetical protein